MLLRSEASLVGVLLPSLRYGWLPSELLNESDDQCYWIQASSTSHLIFPSCKDRLWDKRLVTPIVLVMVGYDGFMHDASFCRCIESQLIIPRRRRITLLYPPPINGVLVHAG